MIICMLNDNADDDDDDMISEYVCVCGTKEEQLYNT